jgi:hypothetical protein
MPSTALAVEPVIDGAKKTADVLVETSASWTTLHSRQVTIPAGSVFNCAVTCASTVNIPVDTNSDNDYRYAASNSLTLSTTDGCVREFDTAQDTSNVDDADNLIVADTCYIPSLSGSPTFYCLGRKVSTADLDLTFDDTSMQIICVDNQG